MKILVAGAGGFIGGHLVKHLLSKNHEVRAIDIKPLANWFQLHSHAQNLQMDLKDFENCIDCTKNIEWIYNLACDMGGVAFIVSNISSCLLNVSINTNLIRAAILNNSKRYFFSSTACIYNTSLQHDPNSLALKEEYAYPALPEEGYGWEKLFSEKLCQSVNDEEKLVTRIARFHNVYGPHGSFADGREKAPAAICYKIAKAQIRQDYNIEIWGDGTQTRSFMYIDDCIQGIEKIMHSDVSEPLNLGSSIRVTINQLVNVVEKIAGISARKKYLIDMPVGVLGRSSDNSKIQNLLGWQPSIEIENGLCETYKWIYEKCCSQY
jgi:nucleoside-diphosphate-sugar epimerase